MGNGASQPKTETVIVQGNPDGLPFLVADRRVGPTASPGKINDTILQVLSGSPASSPTGISVSDNLISKEAVAHASKCRLYSTPARGRVDTIAKVVSFLTKLGSSNQGIETTVLTGVAGSGKTAILSKALQNASNLLRDRKFTVILRYIGTSLQSSTALLLVSSICHQLGLPSPSSNSEISKCLENVFSTASEDHPLIIALDGLDQLANTIDLEMRWMIPALLNVQNPFVRVVLTSVPYPRAPCAKALDRGVESCKFIAIPSLSTDRNEAFAFLDEELKLKSQQPITQTERDFISGSFQIADDEFGGVTPLYLKYLAEGIIPTWRQNPTSMPSVAPASSPECFDDILTTIENAMAAVIPESNKKSASTSNSKSNKKETTNTTSPAAASPAGAPEVPAIALTITTDDGETTETTHQATTSISYSNMEAARILSLLTLARDGLTTQDLQIILPSLPIPAALQAASASKHIVHDDDSGAWKWSHRLEREVAAYRYLGVLMREDGPTSFLFSGSGGDMGEETVRTAKLLADHFGMLGGIQLSEDTAGASAGNGKGAQKGKKGSSSGYGGGWDFKVVRELPRALAMSRRWIELHKILTRFSFLESLCETLGGPDGASQEVRAFHASIQRGLLEQGPIDMMDKLQLDDLASVADTLTCCRQALGVGLEEGILENVLKQEAKNQPRTRERLARRLQDFVKDSMKGSDGAAVEGKAWVFEAETRNLESELECVEPLVLVSPCTRETNKVSKFTTSLDGNLVAAIIDDCEVRVWNTSTFKGKKKGVSADSYLLHESLKPMFSFSILSSLKRTLDALLPKRNRLHCHLPQLHLPRI
jgi:hypothetical protein